MRSTSLSWRWSPLCQGEEFFYFKDPWAAGEHRQGEVEAFRQQRGAVALALLLVIFSWNSKPADTTPYLVSDVDRKGIRPAARSGLSLEEIMLASLALRFLYGFGVFDPLRSQVAQVRYPVPPGCPCDDP